jgi:hypothetical protein
MSACPTVWLDSPLCDDGADVAIAAMIATMRIVVAIVFMCALLCDRVRA